LLLLAIAINGILWIETKIKPKKITIMMLSSMDTQSNVELA